jgi:hypothetical protein
MDRTTTDGFGRAVLGASVMAESPYGRRIAQGVLTAERLEEKRRAVAAVEATDQHGRTVSVARHMVHVG